MKGANIIAIRKRLQLSQAVFARLLNVDRANLCKWEHDKVVPSPVTAAKIAAYRNLGKKAVLQGFLWVKHSAHQSNLNLSS